MALDKADLDTLEKMMDDKLTGFRSEWAKTRGWRHDRWAAIKADKQAAACCVVAGVVLTYAAPYVWKFFVWVM